MLNPDDLVRLETDIAPEDMPASVLCVALGGFVDAGHTERLLADHLLARHSSTVVATFDIDQLLDYRGRRPVMTFASDRFTACEQPVLALHRVIDTEGTPFLLLVGPEPDYQWQRLIEALVTLSDRFGATLTVSVHGIPMAVPHTRPLGVTSHGSNGSLLGSNPHDFGTVQVPGSFSSVLEFALGERGRDVVGFSVHVPHYLGATDFADAAVLGLDRLAAVSGLVLERDTLAGLAEQNRADVDRQVADSAEVAAVVSALEQQYDAFASGTSRPSLLAQDLSDLPSADELGAQVEAFLRNVEDDGS